MIDCRDYSLDSLLKRFSVGIAIFHSLQIPSITFFLFLLIYKGIPETYQACSCNDRGCTHGTQ